VDRRTLMLADHGLYGDTLTGASTGLRDWILEPDLVLPGHGDTFKDGASRAATIAEGKRRRLGRMLAAIRSGSRTVTELTSELYPKPLKDAQLHFVMAEILAYLAYLEVRGQAERVRNPSGVFVWRTAEPVAVSEFLTRE